MKQILFFLDQITQDNQLNLNIVLPKPKKSKQPKPSIKAYFLGGLNEIGKNITVFEYEDEMIVVDCGL